MTFSKCDVETPYWCIELIPTGGMSASMCTCHTAALQSRRRLVEHADSSCSQWPLAGLQQHLPWLTCTVLTGRVHATAWNSRTAVESAHSSRSGPTPCHLCHPQVCMSHHLCSKLHHHLFLDQSSLSPHETLLIARNAACLQNCLFSTVKQ